MSDTKSVSDLSDATRLLHLHADASACASTASDSDFVSTSVPSTLTSQSLFAAQPSSESAQSQSESISLPAVNANHNDAFDRLTLTGDKLGSKVKGIAAAATVGISNSWRSVRITKVEADFVKIPLVSVSIVSVFLNQ